MWKPVVAAAIGLAIAGSSIAYAQQYFDGPGDGGPRFERHSRPSIDDIKAFADARIAGHKAGLQLTPEQEKNWPAFEQAMRDMVKLRIQRIQARLAVSEQPQQTNPFDRMQHWADAMSQRAAVLKQLADAGAPLYQSLNDAQKRRFTALARMLRPHMHAGNGEGWRQGRGGGHDYQGRQSGEDGRGLGGRFHEPGSRDGEE
jgi:hypothetical protein